MRAWIDSQERVGVVGGAAALTLSTGGAAVRRGASLGGAGGDATPSPAVAGGPRQVSVEDVVLPVSTLQAQLFDCVAEDSAIEDLYFQLDDALRKGAWRCSMTRFARVITDPVHTHSRAGGRGRRLARSARTRPEAVSGACHRKGD